MHLPTSEAARCTSRRWRPVCRLRHRKSSRQMLCFTRSGPRGTLHCTSTASTFRDANLEWTTNTLSGPASYEAKYTYIYISKSKQTVTHGGTSGGVRALRENMTACTNPSYCRSVLAVTGWHVIRHSLNKAPVQVESFQSVIFASFRPTVAELDDQAKLCARLLTR